MDRASTRIEDNDFQAPELLTTSTLQGYHPRKPRIFLRPIETMIGNAVASILMRLPVSELSTLRKLFKASPGGLSLESFVAAMLQPPRQTIEKVESYPHKKVNRRRRNQVGLSSHRSKRRRSRCSGKNSGPSVRQPSFSGSGRKPQRATGSQGVQLNQVQRQRVKSSKENRSVKSPWMDIAYSLTDDEKMAIVADLVQLFQQVDHSDDNVLGWEEFMGFLIDQVFALTREAPHAQCLRLRQLGPRDQLHPSKLPVRKARYVRQLGRVLACVGPVVQVWDLCPSSGDISREGMRQTETFLAHSSDETQGSFSGISAAFRDGDVTSRLASVTIDPTRKRATATVFAMDIKYIEVHNVLMVLRSDLSIAFFSADTYIRLGMVKTLSQQYVLEYCPITGITFTSGCDGIILSFATDKHLHQDQKSAQMKAVPFGTLKRHTDVVQDMVAVNGTEAEGGPRLITCGLDREVYVWDTPRGAFVQSKHGNRAAIRSLAVDPSSSLLLGAGMEGEVLAWDIWGHLGSPLFRMQGHRSPILSVACAVGKGRAASLDENGKIILWDTRRNSAVALSDRYLCHMDASMNHPTSLDVVHGEESNFLRWSHIGVSIVSTGRHINVYDVVDSRVSEPPLSVALYSPKCVSFITCNGPFVTLWDACTGKVIRSDKACEGDILCASIDSGERKVILTSSLGEILVFGFLQGIRIRSMTPKHAGPASGMAHVAADKVIVTGGWDRSLRVYDEIPREGDPPLLRQVNGAHSSDINCLVVSQRFSLVATGSADGSCRLWDLQFLSVEENCIIGDEVLCMCFLEPLPILAVGDSGGYVSIIPVRRWLGRGRRNSDLLKFVNAPKAEATIEGPAAVTSITYRLSPSSQEASATATDTQEINGPQSTNTKVTADPVRDIAPMLYVGDDEGVVRAWDISEALLEVDCHTVPEECLPRSKSNYDARRRFYRQAQDMDNQSFRDDIEAGSEAKSHEPVALDSRNPIDQCLHTRPALLSEDNGAVAHQSRHHVERQGAVCLVPNTLAGVSDKEELVEALSEERHVIRATQEMGLDKAIPAFEAKKRTNASMEIRVVKADGDQTTHFRVEGVEKGSSQKAAESDIPPVADLIANGTGSQGFQEASQACDHIESMRVNVRVEDHAVEPDTSGVPARNSTVLIGEWFPHTEAVVSLQVIEDPPCLLTASRDRSVKLRALPIDYRAKCVSGNSDVSNDLHGGHCMRQKQDGLPIGGVEMCNETNLMTSKDSSSDSSITKLYKYGYELSTLTLGRIADGFRRDCFDFPLDLRGRGQGKAIEARAVMQAIDEIEQRRDKRRRDEEAVNRARGAVASATSTTAVHTAAGGAMKSTIYRRKSISTDRQAGPSTDHGTTTRKTSVNGTGLTSASEVADRDKSLPSDKEERHSNGSTAQSKHLETKDRTLESSSSAVKSKAISDLNRSSTRDIHARQGEHKRTLGAKGGKSQAHMANNDVPTSKDAGHKHSHCSGGAIRENPSGATASITRRGRNPGFSERFSASTYENMAAEMKRLKYSEGGKALTKSKCEETEMKQLLEPSSFLLEQMPDVLSSYPVTAAIVDPRRDRGICIPGLSNKQDLSNGKVYAVKESGNLSSVFLDASKADKTSAVLCDEEGCVEKSAEDAGLKAEEVNDVLMAKVVRERPHCSIGKQPSLLDYSNGEAAYSQTRDLEINENDRSSPSSPPLLGESKNTSNLSWSTSCPAHRLPSVEAGTCGDETGRADGVDHRAEYRVPPGVEIALASVQDTEKFPVDEFYGRVTDDAFYPNRKQDYTSEVGSLSSAVWNPDACVEGSVEANKHHETSGREDGRPRNVQTEMRREWERANCKARSSEGSPDDLIVKLDSTASSSKIDVPAKVESRRLPRTISPGEISMASNFGPASRWGELSKAHVEFHRMGTAGLLASMSCPSLRRHFKPNKNMSGGKLLPLAKSFRLTRKATEAIATASAIGRGHCAVSPHLTQTPFPPSDLNDLASRYEQAQACWKRRLEAFAMEKDALTHHMCRCPDTTQGPQPRVTTPGRGSIMRNGRKLRSGKRGRYCDTDRECRYISAGQEQYQESAQDGYSTLPAKTLFGPYGRDELEAVWNVFESSQAFGTKVDVRVLFKHPFLRDSPPHRRNNVLQSCAAHASTLSSLESLDLPRHLQEILESSKRQGPIIMGKKDVLLKLFPLLGRSEARSFANIMKVREGDKEPLMNEAGAGEVIVDDEVEHETKSSKVGELRGLFALYTADDSGHIDAQEVVASLRTNRVLEQMATVVGHAMTESNLASLMSSISEMSRRSDEGNTKAGEAGTGDGRGRSEMSFFEFHRIFQDLL